MFRSLDYHSKTLAQEYLQCSLVLVFFPEFDINLSDLGLVLVSPWHDRTVEPALTFPSLQRYWNSIPWPSPRILYEGAPPWDVDCRTFLRSSLSCVRSLLERGAGAGPLL